MDISLAMDQQLLTWPSDPVYRLHKFASFESGKPCDASEVSMSVHTGTHIDAPAHFIQGGATMMAWKPEITCGPCRIVEIEHSTAITADELIPLNIKQGERVLFRTKNSDKIWWQQAFDESFIHIAPDAAALLAALKPACVGIDYLSVGSPTTGVETHQLLLGANIWLLESLNLTQVIPGTYELLFLPIHLSEAEAAPGRALIKKL
jgi:arylformamidase